MEKVSPCTPFKNFCTKNHPNRFVSTLTDSRREVKLALAAASSQAPPRPCSLRELNRRKVGATIDRPQKKTNV